MVILNKGTYKVQFLTGPFIANLENLRVAAFKSPNISRGIWQIAGISPENAGIGLFLLGDFSNAANVLESIASKELDAVIKSKFASRSFESFQIADKPLDASVVAHTYGLEEFIPRNEVAKSNGIVWV